MSPETEELLHCTYALKQKLLQVLPQEAVDHIMTLLVQDLAHRKFLKLTEKNQ